MRAMLRTLQKFLWEWRWFGVVLLGFVVTIGVILLLLLIYFGNHVLPGVKVVDQSVGGMNQAAVKDVVAQALMGYPRELTLSFEGRDFHVSLSDIGFSPNIDDTAMATTLYGKRWPHIMALLQPGDMVNLPLLMDLDQMQLQLQIETIALELETQGVDPEVQVASNEAVLVIQGTRGIHIDKSLLRKEITKHLETLNRGAIEIPVQIDDRRAKDEQLRDMQQRAQILVGKRLLLKSDAHDDLPLLGVQLAKLVSAQGQYSTQSLSLLADDVAATLDSQPRDAIFRFNSQTGRVEEFAAELSGHKVQKTKLLTSLPDTLLRLELEATDSAMMQVPVEIITPKVRAEEVNSLGIHELIGKGESFFKGSIPSRAHNIKLAASRINGAIVPPGETLSFNQIVGEIASTTGYQPAYVIQNGKTILGDGGGVCQVSSTVFRAALNTGLPIEERHAHSYRVAYYEQQSHPGLDATIFSPSVDLKIKNDTPAHILIQTTLDEAKSHLTVDIYGTSDGRSIEMGNYRLWDVVAPPPDMYVDDPTLPMGQVKQIEHRIAGAKAGFDWKVSRNGEVINEKTFVSVFRPWQAVYLRGVKQ